MSLFQILKAFVRRFSHKRISFSLCEFSPCHSSKKMLLACATTFAATQIQLPSENLTYDSLIRQACVTTVNSTTTLLTTTASTFFEIGAKYKESMGYLLGLLEQSALLDAVSDELWDSIIEERIKVNIMRSNLTELQTYMQSVEKLVMSTSESAYLAGAEYLCGTLLERLESCKVQIERELIEIKLLEDEYLKLHTEFIKKTGKES